MPRLVQGANVNIPAGISKIIIIGNNNNYRVTFHSQPPATRSGVLPPNGAELRIQVNPLVASTLTNTGNSPFDWRTT